MGWKLTFYLSYLYHLHYISNECVRSYALHLNPFFVINSCKQCVQELYHKLRRNIEFIFWVNPSLAPIGSRARIVQIRITWNGRKPKIYQRSGLSRMNGYINTCSFTLLTAYFPPPPPNYSNNCPVVSYSVTLTSGVLIRCCSPSYSERD